MTSRNVGLLLWLLIGGVAAAIVSWQLMHPPRLSTTINANRLPELPVVEPMSPFRLPPLERYGEIIAHPVFIATRQPESPFEEPESGAPAPPGPEQKFSLLGVMITSKLKMALLRPEGSNAKTMRVGPGGTVGEWQLDAVFPDRIVLRKGEVTQELPLTRPERPTKRRARQADAGSGRNIPPPVNRPVAAPRPNSPDIGRSRAIERRSRDMRPAEGAMVPPRPDPPDR
ncbi:MAG: hypothetical protein IAF00_05565 [Phycisphaerales bacterium]|nr:hypothetical protein [Phycisphaerales bacterium]